MKKKTITISDDSVTMDSSLWSRLPPDMLTHLLSPTHQVSLPIQVRVSLLELPNLFPHFAKTYLHLTNTTNKPQKTLLSSTSQALYSVNLAAANPTAEDLDFPSIKWSKVWDLAMVWFDGFHIFRCGLGYDSSTDDYKVVMLHCHIEYGGGAYITHVAVYSLKNDAWRGTQDSHYVLLEFQLGVYINERLPSPYEVFKEVWLPTSFNDYRFEYHLIAVLWGCLSLVVWPFSHEEIEVRMMKKYGVKESWTKFPIANHGMPIENVWYWPAKDKFMLIIDGMIENDNVEMMLDESDGDKLVSYNVEKETLRDMVVCGISTKYGVGDDYIETLVSLNGGRIRRQCEASSGES
ncbi:F-box/kelch-repeat protein At3g06240-like [Rhododendron vialii]|uniref:F-box/kelch-repeat protein At3g06240-like n=1 Tax=Rhododendron vialii TaxID=182163 RepID=UPI00265E6862|nr:F-box/kelch-repeat protein At3g06240-like [Rhododendron vialii]